MLTAALFSIARTLKQPRWPSREEWIKIWHDVKWSEVTQSCPSLCNPMDYSLPGSSILGIFQARVLEWVANSFSRGSSQPRDRIWVSHIAVRCFTIWSTREAPVKNMVHIYNGTLLSHKKEQDCRDMDRPRDCHTERDKSEKQILHINAYTWNLENSIDEPVC